MVFDPVAKVARSREELYRRIPSVNQVLLAPEVQQLITTNGHERVVTAVRQTVDALRTEIAAVELSSYAFDDALETLAARVGEMLRRGPEYSLKPVINATGVVLHTNLGRAPLCQAALSHVAEVARDYCNLEIDLETGERSTRDTHIEHLLLSVLGVHGNDVARWGVVVVNNCAAATFLALNTLAEKREVVVSRGELVEIGGGFRIPEILEKSGAFLREVGTTNRTRAADYEQAISEKSSLMLRVHQSNFSIEGFAERPSLKEMVELAKTMGVPLFEDQGTGLVSRLDEIGVANQPTLQDSIAAGVDLVAASGDKLLGGPQCGLVVGRADLIARIRKNPLLRAFRVDKLIYAALEATLVEYVAASGANLPLMKMLRTPAEELERRCNALAASINTARINAVVIPVDSVIGGGTAPGARLRGYAVSLRHCQLGADEFLQSLRHSTPPIVARIVEDAVVLDLRTVPLHMDETIAALIKGL